MPPIRVYADTSVFGGVFDPEFQSASPHAEDALHVAIASVTGCSLVVSWIFRHIVHFQKIPLYNAVNILKGYDQIGVFSPLEVLSYEEGI